LLIEYLESNSTRNERGEKYVGSGASEKFMQPVGWESHILFSFESDVCEFDP
jgi:hypothetical protein